MQERIRTVLITGASAGIGEAFAREYAARGCNLILTARREDRLQALAGQLNAKHSVKVSTVTSDLSHTDAPQKIKETVDLAGLEVDVLVNNVGYGVPNTFLANPWHVHRDTLQVMVQTVAELCYLFAPAMRERGSGVIVNVASLAGHLPGTRRAPCGHTRTFAPLM